MSELTPEREAKIRRNATQGQPIIRDLLREIDRLRAEVERLTAENGALYECVGLLDAGSAKWFRHAWRTHPYLDRFMERTARREALRQHEART